MSLQEKYFLKIVNEQKKNEYRFSFVKTKSKAYIYLPKDKQQVVGVLYLGVPQWHDAETSAEIYANIGDGEYSVMYDWVEGRGGCYTIPIERCVRFAEPIPKETLKDIPDFIAPQSYILLKNRDALREVLHSHELSDKKNRNDG